MPLLSPFNMTSKEVGTIAAETWTETTYDHVVFSFLKAEWSEFPSHIRAQWGSIVENPCLSDSRENQMRMRLLNIRRSRLLSQIPDDTIWFAVTYLRRSHLNELRAINHRAWRSPMDLNELPKVALRKRAPLRSHPSTWANPILWSHTTGGPFTILEGNHRLTALAAAVPLPDFEIAVYIGLSGGTCFCHLPDQVAQTSGWDCIVP